MMMFKYAIVTGDEVLQWNGVPLQGRSAEEVAAVVANSKHDSHVELVVSRPLASPRPPPMSWRAHKGKHRGPGAATDKVPRRSDDAQKKLNFRLFYEGQKVLCESRVAVS